jgi:hypothetical protein
VTSDVDTNLSLAKGNLNKALGLASNAAGQLSENFVFPEFSRIPTRGCTYS